jgi:iron(III) transport system permease protein
MKFLILLFLFILCVFPLFYLIKSLVLTDSGIDFSLFLNIWEQSLTATSIKNSLIICSLTVLLSCFLAIPIAWLITRSDIGLKKFWRTLFSLPYAIPPFIGAIAWIQLANPSNGLLKNIIPGINIYTSFGLVFVMSTFFYTFILLNVLSTLEKIDPSLEESARISGATPSQVFFKITLPLLLPSLLTGMLLTFLSALANFGIAALIGNPASISMMTTQIYMLQKTASQSGLRLSGALSVVLLVISMSIFALDYYVSNKFRYSLITGKTSRPSLVELGRFKKLATAFLIMMSVILFLLPIAAIFLSSISKVQGAFSWDSMTFENYVTILFKTDETFRALNNSFFLALSTAFLCLILGYILAKISKNLNPKINHLKELFIAVPYAVPGTVLALALTLVVLSYNLPLYNTLGIILLAYTVKFLNFSYKSLYNGIHQIDQSLIDAAKIAGAHGMARLRHIWIPLLLPFIMASLFLVFMPAFSELTMSVLLSGPGNETIGTLIFQLQEYGDASGSGAAVLSCCTVFFILILNYILKILTKGKFGL